MKIPCASLFLAFTIACGGGSSTKPAETKPAETQPTQPVAPKADLSTEDAARTTILETLKRGDKAAFRTMVSKRILERHKDFDAYYTVWEQGAKTAPDKFKKITVTKEDGVFKLDEN